MLYQISNGTVSVGGGVILSHIDFEIHGNEKIAVVGRNGAGKTTLLKSILGITPALSGDRESGVPASSLWECCPSRRLRTETGPWRRSFWRPVPAGTPLSGNGLNTSVSTIPFLPVSDFQSKIRKSPLAGFQAENRPR